MSDAPSDPKEMADMLDAMAKRMRKARAPGEVAPASFPGGLFVSAPGAGIELRTPWVGEIDVLSDETHVTVTAETRNADAAHVQVSVADGRLLIGIGQGADSVRHDLPLPVAVDEEHAYATFRNGVLDVVLPRKGAPGLRRGD